MSDKSPCPECTGWVLPHGTDYYKCGSCKKDFPRQYILGYRNGKNKAQKDIKGVINKLKLQIKRLTNSLQSRSKGTFSPVKRASISSADAKRLIVEVYHKSNIDKKTMPTPKQLDSEFLLWNGSKIKKDEVGSFVKYYIIGYSQRGEDVIEIIRWLHQI